MRTYLIGSPGLAALASIDRSGRIRLSPAHAPSFRRTSNPEVGHPDREIVRRLVLDLGYTPRPGSKITAPPGFKIEPPDVVGLRRTWSAAWDEDRNEYRARTGHWPTTSQVGLLTENAKLIKGRDAIVVLGLSLAPATTSGHNLCIFSTEECRRLCLFGTGKGPSPAHKKALERAKKLFGHLIRYGGGPEIARLGRTIWLFEDPFGFLLHLSQDVLAFMAYGRRFGFTPAIRMNVFSDIRWENIPFPDLRAGVWRRNVFEAFPEIQFYDYTKDPARDLPRLPRNYDLTFSLAETTANQKHAYRMLQRGMNIAVVFDIAAGHPLPRTFWGVPVIDGDKSDLRFLDPKPRVVGLRFKNLTGAAAQAEGKKEEYKQKYGFIQPIMQCGNGMVVAANGKQFDASAFLLAKRRGRA